MALVDSLKLGFKDKEQIHQRTECSYFIITDRLGKKILQIDTYGSENRAIPGKVSQSIQFSSHALQQLKEIISDIT